MGNYILFILLLVNLWISFSNPWKGILYYLTFSLISPIFHFNGSFIPYQVIGFFPVVLLYFLKERRYLITSFYILILIYFLFLFISTFISFIFNIGTVNYISLFGSFRFIIIIFLIFNKNLYKIEEIYKAFLIISIISLVTSLIQLTIHSSTMLFYDLYWRPSMTPIIAAVNMGKFIRGMGTFGTPTLLGAFSLIAFCVFYFRLRYNGFNWKLFFCVIINFVCGIFALSKIFILGLPIIIIIDFLFYFFNRLHVNKIIIKRKFFYFLIIGIGIGAISIVWLVKQGIPILWYLNYLLKPLDAFATRYDSASGGNLINVLSVIKNNILFGVGDVTLKDVFLGDSSYFVLLYNVGLIGSIPLLMYWFGCLYFSLKSGKEYYIFFFVLISLLLIFTGANILATPLGILAISFASYPLILKTKHFSLNLTK